MYHIESQKDKSLLLTEKNRILQVITYDKTNNKAIACDTSNAKSIKTCRKKAACKNVHESQNGGGWKAPLQVIWSIHLLKQGHLNHSAQDGQVVQMASPQMVTPQP